MFRPHKIEWTREKAQHLWDYYSSNPSYRSAYFGFRCGRFAARLINRTIGFRNVRAILDFGCGKGDLIAACLPYVRGKIAGVDFSQKSVDVVMQRFQAASAFEGAAVVRSFPSSYPDGSFDLILCTEVVEHLTDEQLAETMREVRRLLTSKGRVFITTPNNEDYAADEVLCPDCGSTFHRWQHLRTWTAESLRSRIDSSGFISELVEPVAWAPLLRKAVAFAKPLPKDGLVYIGRKQ